MRHAAFALFSVAALSACSDKPSYENISGQTMGTSYHISYAHPKGTDAKTIQADIDARLDEIIASMSTYEADSTISKFNRLPSAVPLAIDGDFAKVFSDSQSIYEKSHHAFDPTVFPLVELWGFGGQMRVDRLLAPPSSDEIAKAKATVGLDKVQLNGDKLSKTTDGVGLDFSAIAKGYAVDVIAQVLKDKGVRDYMVEIGGEIATMGKNNKGAPWRLAIDAPVLDSSVKSRETITTLTQPTDGTLHIATSGGYRNSIEYNGTRYSHTINPVTAQPVADSAPSVTVAHDSVALADGWATALTAIPAADAVQLADEAGIAAVFVLQNPAGSGFIIQKSRAMSERYGD